MLFDYAIQQKSQYNFNSLSTKILPPTKGPLFKKDDCTLPVYLHLLFYAL